MTAQIQVRQPDKLPQQKRTRQWFSRRSLIVLTIILIAFILAAIWILSTFAIIPNTWATISYIIVTIFGVVFASLQSLHLFIPAEKYEPRIPPEHIPATLTSTSQSLPPQSTPPNKSTHRAIVGLPPLADPRTIQQREPLVEELFVQLRSWGGNTILLELYQLLLPENKWRPEPVQEARIYNNLAVIYRILGYNDQALEYLQKALNICEAAGERGTLGWVLNSLGRVYDDLGQKKEAEKFYKQALLVLEEVGDRKGPGIILNNLARVYTELGNQEKTLEYLEQALKICEEVGNREQANRALNNLGRVYNDLGQLRLALEYFQKALRRCKEIGDRGGEGWTLNNLGKVYAYLGQKELARDCLEQGLHIRREERNRLGEGRTLNNLSLAHILLGQHDQALECCKEALNIASSIGDRLGQGLILNNFGLPDCGAGIS